MADITDSQQNNTSPEQSQSTPATRSQSFSSTSFPENLLRNSAIPLYTAISIYESVDNFYSISTDIKPLGQIFLPPPHDLDTSYRANWQQEDLRSVGAEDLSGVLNTVASEMLLPTTGGSPVQMYLKTRNMMVANPYKSLMYSGHDLRTFTWKWELVANNMGEVDRIHDTIYLLKKYMHSPSQYNEPTLSNPPMWQFRVCDKNGSRNYAKYLFNIKHCVVTEVSVNYTPKGLAFHKTNVPGEIAPVGVDVQISFTETSINTQTDFKSIEESL